MKRHAMRPPGRKLVYTAAEELCVDCGRAVPICQTISRPVQGLDEQLILVRRDRQCRRTCPGARPFFHATRDLRVVLPNRIYGLDVTLLVGERHIREGVSLARLARDLNARGVPLDQRHASRILRDFLALARLARGDDAALQARLREQGGIVLMVDGVQYDEASPVLYLAWDARSGTPLFGERKLYRGADDLVPLLERVKKMDVPLIGVVTDKEKGLVPAVESVFPDVPYQFCHTHFLRNCAKPLQGDLTALQASVRRRAEAVREIAKRLSIETAPTPAQAPAIGASAALPVVDTARAEVEFAQEVCELVRANSRITGKAPLDPAEMKRHHRLESIRDLVREAGEKTAEPRGWPVISALSEALTPTWQEVRLAGRVERHRDILRGIAHQLSTAPDRADRPATAAVAKQRYEAHLADLLANTPRAGLAAATGEFIDSIIERTDRYKDHLFHCFDDPRIPANTNELERFFGCSKRSLRHSGGCGSTTNSVLTNLGAEPLLAFQQLRTGGAFEGSPEHTPAEFRTVRQLLAVDEAPAIRRRSIVRHFDRHVERLRSTWLRR